jgi:uncharacterized protein YxjI
LSDGSSSSSLLAANDIILKKKILSLREHYDLEDRNGAKIGEADGNFFQFPAKFNVYGASGSQVVMHIEGKLISLRKEFTLHDVSGAALGTIKKKLVKLIGEEYWIEKDGVEFMRIYGNFTEHDYKMVASGVEVATVHKKWIAIRDTIGLSITGDVDHRIVLGALIVIEHIEVTERAREHHR